MRCDEISADWAAQRIKGLSLANAVWTSFFPPKGNPHPSKTIKTLIHSFRYPRLGPGMMWDEAARRTKNAGGQVLMGTKVTQLMQIGSESRWRLFFTATNGTQSHRDFDFVISSAPLRELMQSITPTPSESESYCSLF